MKKDAIIKIVSMQSTENGTESGEMSVVGTVEHENGKSVINYIENNAETGLENTSITIIDGSAVSIVREGAFSSEMTVEKANATTHFIKRPLVNSQWVFTETVSIGFATVQKVC